MVLRMRGGGASMRLVLAIMGTLVVTAPHGVWSYGFPSSRPSETNAHVHAHAQADANVNGHEHGRGLENVRELSSHSHQTHPSFGYQNRAVNTQKQTGENRRKGGWRGGSGAILLTLRSGSSARASCLTLHLSLCYALSQHS